LAAALPSSKGSAAGIDLENDCLLFGDLVLHKGHDDSADEGEVRGKLIVTKRTSSNAGRSEKGTGFCPRWIACGQETAGLQSVKTGCLHWG